MLKYLLLSTLVLHHISGQRFRQVGEFFFPEEGGDASILDYVNRAGIMDVVTPDPILSSSTLVPTVLQKDGVKCTCRPYFECRAPDELASQNKQAEIDVNFDPDGCQDVLDVCCKDADSLVIPQNNSVTNQPNQPQGCGLRNIGGIDFTLTGNFNNEAGFGEFPWTVAIINVASGQFICGGSLIEENLVLTGAHCVLQYGENQLKIRAGEWDTQTTKERLPFQERNVKRIVPHNDFNPKSLANDVAILELASPVQLGDHIKIACLAPTNYDLNQNQCFASGWGKNLFGKQGQFSVIMKKVPLPLVDSSTCQTQLQGTRLSRRFQLHSTFLCAGGQEGIDTCQGDGGAPLVCPVGRANDNRYAQVGIVAWGIGCNTKIPAVYANTVVMRPWIDNVVRTLGYDVTKYDPTRF